MCDTSLSSALYGELFLPICIESARIRHHDDTGSIGTKIVVYRIAPEAQAIFCRRRAKTRRTAQAKIRPGKPAPTIGPGTGTGTKTIYAGAQLAKQVDPSYTNFVSPSISSEIMAHVGIPTRASEESLGPGGVAFPLGPAR